MSELQLTYRGMVFPWQCDHMGNMDVMWYTGKFDEATWQMFARLGLTRTYLREQGSLVTTVQHETSYTRQLRAGAVISIRSGIIEIREKVVRLMHEMRDDETAAVAAVSAVTGVHMDAEMRRACAFPDDFLRRARQYLSDHGPADPEEIHDTLPQKSFPPAPPKPVFCRDL